MEFTGWHSIRLSSSFSLLAIRIEWNRLIVCVCVCEKKWENVEQRDTQIIHFHQKDCHHSCFPLFVVPSWRQTSCVSVCLCVRLPLNVIRIRIHKSQRKTYGKSAKPSVRKNIMFTHSNTSTVVAEYFLPSNCRNSSCPELSLFYNKFNRNVISIVYFMFSSMCGLLLCEYVSNALNFLISNFSICRFCSVCSFLFFLFFSLRLTLAHPHSLRSIDVRDERSKCFASNENAKVRRWITKPRNSILLMWS